MRPSDLAKIAAGLAAGSITHDAALSLLGGDHGLLDKLLAGGAGIAGAAIGGSLAGRVMDEVGISEALDDAGDAIADAFGF